MSEKNKEMKTEDLIASLEEKGIKLWTDNGKLRYSAPQGVMNSDIVQLLKKNKENILESLSHAKDELEIVHDEEKRYGNTTIENRNKDVKSFLFRKSRVHTLWAEPRVWSTVVLLAISIWSLNTTT